MSTQTTLVMARQAGSAAALAPVVRDMRARHDRVVVCAAAGTAQAGFGAVGIAPDVALPRETSVNEFADWLNRLAVDSILTGTSFEAGLDGRLWSAARMVGAPAVALLDHWCNYAERFSDRTHLDCLPDALAVMDDVAVSALRAIGFPQDRLHVTGHPHLDEIVPITSDERSTARRSLDIADDRQVVTFASEPVSIGHQYDLGYTSAEVLETVASAIADVAPAALLVVRPHPREDRMFESSGGPETVLVRTGAPRDAIAASDVMTGMRSMLLLEAALAGVPTLSVRPNGGPDEYIDAHKDLIASVRDVDALPGALIRVLSLPPGWQPQMHAPRGRALLGGASGRVIRLLDELSRRSQSA